MRCSPMRCVIYRRVSTEDQVKEFPNLDHSFATPLAFCFETIVRYFRGI